MFFRPKPAPVSLIEKAMTAAAEGALAVSVVDEAGTFVQVNATYAGLLGYTVEELLGQPIATVLDPEEATPAARARFWAALRAGKALRATSARRSKGGKRIWIEATHIPVADASGKIAYSAVVSVDVTEKMRETKHMEAQLAAIGRSSARIEFDLEGKVIDVNEMFLQLMGYTRAEVIGQHHAMFVPEDIVASNYYKRFWEGLRAGDFHSDRFQRVTRAGERIWLQGSYSPVHDLDGNLVAVIKLAHDVTEDFLRAADTAGMIAALNLSLAVIEFDLNGKVLHANSNFEQALGYTEYEIIGRHHAMFLSPEERDSPAYVAFWDDLRRGVPKVAEFRRIAKSGDSVWIQASYNPIIGPNGTPLKVVKFATDVTARKMAIIAFQAAITALSAGALDDRLERPMTPEFEALRQDFNLAIDRMAELVGAILASAQTIRAETESLSGASAELGRRTETQAASLEETAAAINQLASSVESSSAGARNAAGAVSKARARSRAGRSVVEQTISAMSEIARGSEQISRITAVIDDIAFQTNLLALNAGVEAARAGETGRGFAVVASEVRALAQRSSEAAREIAELIETSGRQVRQGVDLVNESGQALGEIDTLVAEVDTLVQAIASSATEQATGLGEVSSAVNQLDQVTQQNAAMFEESAAAVAMLRDQAGQLAAQGAAFRIGSTPVSERDRLAS
ncbi:PAS domain S-box protein [Rhodobacter capsulatus]|uniref:PAS domain S-box protein n=1 Tax=Rhodobacter capsulatus TaxID=1061 RepID=A0A4U1JNK6_RHOCA|nr:PAS domain S-box protein [Rhodobacter capsulatus]TKD17470.1 PAS domain S-box protein [Rhodobacter capsulatus]